MSELNALPVTSEPDGPLHTLRESVSDLPPTDMSSEDSNTSKIDNVRVAVRVRPLNARERLAAADFKFSWIIDSKSIIQAHNDKPIQSNSFFFDNVFQPPANNAVIFENIAKPVVASAVEGVNGVIFAYGQTAAGKTHTMLGNDIDPGVTPRSIQGVFDYIGACPSRQFLLRATYIEIYNEIIRDLLFPANDNLKIHEDAINKRVFVDAKEEIVSSVEQVMNIIALGEQVRAVGETNMNDRSSRSHTIFSLKIESREMTAADARDRRRTIALQSGVPFEEEDEADEDDDASNDGVAIRASSLSLVDLAGSERASFTKAQGMRLVEGGHINKSLLTLGNVINKLSSSESRSLAHIPYRDSKLTRLLQPALGGNARTAIICAVTPAVLHMDETMSTLKFASRAKKVTNSAKTNEFLDDRAKLRRAERLIIELRRQLQTAARTSGGSHSSGMRPSPSSDRAIVSPGLAKSNKTRFDRLLETIENTGKGSLASVSSPVRKKRRLVSHSFLHALHLMCGSSAQQLNGSSSHEIPALAAESQHNNLLTEMAELRKKAFNAEREKRLKLAEICYEREAMQREVAELVRAVEESNRYRDMAEHECEEAHFALARATAKSLVDEIVSEAMSTSSLKADLRAAGMKLKAMDAIKAENESTQENLANLRKQIIEFQKREKRGIGPVLKDCKTAQNKLSETENKLRSAKQNFNQLSMEKSRLDREVKGRERQIKALTCRIEQQQRRDETRLQNRLQKEVAEVRRKAETETNELRATIDTLTEQVKAYNIKVEMTSVMLQETKKKLAETEREKLQTTDHLKESNQILGELQKKIEVDTKNRMELEKNLLDVRSQVDATKSDLKKMTSELQQCQKDLDNKSTEVDKAAIDAEHLRRSVCDANERIRAEERKRLDLEKILEEQQALVASTFADASKWEARAGNERSLREQEEAKRSLAEQTAQKLEGEIGQKVSEIDQLQSKIAKVEVDHKSFALKNETHLQEAKREIESIHQRALNIDAEKSEIIMQLEAKCAHLETQINHLKDHLSRSNADLEKTQLSHNESIEKHHMNVKLMESEAQNTREELRMCQNELARVQTASEEVLQHTDSRIVQLEAIASEKDLSLRERECTVRELQNELELCNENWRVLVEKKDKVIQARDETAISLMETIDKMKTQISDQEHAIKVFAAQQDANKQTEDQLGILKEEVENLKTKAEQAESDVRISREANADKTAVNEKVKELQKEMALLLEEDIMRKRELRKMMEAVRARDHKIYELEGKITQWTHGDGEISRLNKRIARRDAIIDSLTRDVDRYRTVVAADKSDLLIRDMARLAEIESENAALRAEKQALSARVDLLQKTGDNAKLETIRLRDIIKDSNIRKVDRAILWKQSMLDDVRKNGTLQERSVNTPDSSAVK